MKAENQIRNSTFLLLTFFGILLSLLLSFTIREDSIRLLSLFFALFIVYVLLVRINLDVRAIVISGIILRLCFFFAPPNLSDDYFRFVFDGHLIIKGINPYIVQPVFLQTQSEAIQNIISQMNSPEYYSVYPPMSQLLFVPFSATYLIHPFFGFTTLRLILLVADLFSLRYILLLSKKLNLKANRVGILYFLNPLILVELTGNLHLEGVVIAFLLGSIYYFTRSHYFSSGASMASAFFTKMTPLIILPFLLRKNKAKHSALLIFGFLVLSLIYIFPFFQTEFFSNIFNSILLFVQRFEFNAGIYYLIRYFGELITGYNPIKYIGPALFIFMLLLFAWRWEKQKPGLKELLVSVLFVYGAYYLLSTTVHPWYITLLVFPGAMLGYIFPIVWSALVMLSYTAYAQQPVEQNYVLVAIEYIVVLAFLVYEIRKGPVLRPIIKAA